MFYREQSDQYITESTSFSIDGTSYPSNWLNMTSPEDKAALGLVEVTNANEPEDDRFYWVSDTLSGAVRTYTNTPKDLDPLKANWVIQINQTAYTMLLPSDWMVVKGIETSTPVPADWGTYRAAVRTAAATTITAINASTTIAELQTAIQVTWPNDPNYIAVDVAVEAVEAP
jgi:hypothetical protein